MIPERTDQGPIKKILNYDSCAAMPQYFGHSSFVGVHCIQPGVEDEKGREASVISDLVIWMR